MDPRYHKEKAENGCVIRAFEHALGVWAMPRETALRLYQYARAEIDARVCFDSLPDGAEREAAINAPGIRDRKSWRRLIDHLRHVDSPFGRALNGVNIQEFSGWSDEDVRRALWNRERIIADNDGHISSLGVDVKGRIYQASDVGSPEFVPTEKIVVMYVRKKEG